MTTMSRVKGGFGDRTLNTSCNAKLNRSQTWKEDFWKEKMKPSSYVKLCQMKLPAEEIVRYLNTLWSNYKTEDEDTESAKLIYVPCNKNCFFPFVPSNPAIIFSALEHHSTQERQLSFRNVDTKPRSIRIMYPLSSNFRVINPVNYHLKVAAGMTITFQVEFKSDRREDYYCELQCNADDSLLIIPIFALGPRGIMDFPDIIDFPVCPVKQHVTKTLVIRNIGDRDARFTLNVMGLFSAVPKHGVLPVNDVMHIDLEFSPIKVGDFCGSLLVAYDTGETIQVTLAGTAEDVNVRLEKSTLYLQNTYIGLHSERQIKLINGSDVITSFRWSSYSTAEEESATSVQMSLNSKVTDGVEPMFEGGVIKIEPREGELWPKDSMDFAVVFSPPAAKRYVLTVYCDVAGRENRLPLKISAEGMGPILRFTNNRIDMGKVLVGSVHTYEASIALTAFAATLATIRNEGEIPATYVYSKSQSMIGSYFKFSPESDMLPPGGIGVLDIRISCPKLGDFYEEFNFIVDKALKPLTLLIFGVFIGPTLAFESTKLIFGSVAYGYPTVRFVALQNMSSISVAFHLRVIEDDTAEESQKDISVQSKDDFQKSYAFGTILGKSKDINVFPINGTLAPMSITRIQVSLTAHSLKSYKLHMIVDVQGVGKAVTHTTITARSMVPVLTLVEPCLKLDRCFLNYPYDTMIHLKNESSVPALYHILPQSTTNTMRPPTIAYESLQPTGVIDPLSTASIPITVTALDVGVLQENLHVTVTGDFQPPLVLPINCTACGPVVDIQPESMDWGLVPVLVKVSKPIRITNISPIAAQFFISLVNINSVWRVEPMEGSVAPESSTEILVTAYFQDTQRFQDKVTIKIAHSMTYHITVCAKAYGATIVLNPPFTSPLVLGPAFSNVLFQKKMEVTNHGRKSHILFWAAEVPKSDQDKMSAYVPPTFRIMPAITDLAPGQTMEIILEAISPKAQKMTEIITCLGTKGRARNKELVMQFEIIAEFIAPSIEYSMSKINFDVRKEQGVPLQAQIQSLGMKNIALLPLTVNLKADFPFQLVMDGLMYTSKMTIVIPVDSCVEVLIAFDPYFKDDNFSRSAEVDLVISFAEHPQVDHIKLHGWVYFPNLILSHTEIDFEKVCNGIEKKKCITMSNLGPLEAKYYWHIQIESRCQQPRLKSSRTESSVIVSSAKAYKRSMWPTVEEEWDKMLCVYPMCGCLQPGDCQCVVFVFSGESSIELSGTAICHVEGGPMYEVKLKAQATAISYKLHPSDLDLDNLVFNDVAEVKLKLENVGSIDFSYTANVLLPKEASFRTTDQSADKSCKLHTGNKRITNICVEYRDQCCSLGCLLLVHPERGHLAAHEVAEISVKILPTLPFRFHGSIMICVAHFEPDIVDVHGYGVYPYVTVYNFPETSKTTTIQQQLIENRTKVERCIVDTLKDVEWGCAGCLSLHHQAKAMKATLVQKCFEELDGPETNVNFGYVVLGTVMTKEIDLVNNSTLPVSFKLDSGKLATCGFHADIDQVKALPVDKAVKINLTFDPRSADIKEGKLELSTYIKVVNGPSTSLNLFAYVTKPTIQLSLHMIDFGMVQCGYCKIVTVQMFNDGYVPCQWESIRKKVSWCKPLYSVPPGSKALTYGIIAPTFEIVPCGGYLEPNERINIEVKFTPTEERLYNRTVKFKLKKSTFHPVLEMTGYGMEPVIELSSPVMEFEAVLPGFSGNEKELIIKNPCSFPIEFYNLENDIQYKEEDKLLRLLDDYDEFNSILLPPREVGDKLPTEVQVYLSDLLSKLKDFVALCTKEYLGKSESSAVEEVNESVNYSADLQGSFQECTSVKSFAAAETRGKMHFLPEYTDVEKAFIIKILNQYVEGDVGRTLNISNLPEHIQEEFYQILKKFYVGATSMEPFKTPVQLSLDSYLSPLKYAGGSIDLSLYGMVLVVSGAPETDESCANLCASLAQHYELPILIVDDIIKEAMLAGETAAGLTAREICLNMRRSSSVSVFDHQKIFTDFTLTQSSVKRRSVPCESKSALSLVIAAEEAGVSFEGTKFTEDDIVSVALPCEIFESIIEHRIRQPDCCIGMIINGLHSMFAANTTVTVLSLLKVFGGRNYIYFASLHKEFSRMKMMVEEQMKVKDTQKKKLEQEEISLIREMSEDSYEALSESEQQRVDMIIRRIKTSWLSELANKKQVSMGIASPNEVLKLKQKKGKTGEETASPGGRRNVSIDSKTRREEASGPKSGSGWSLMEDTDTSTARRYQDYDYEFRELDIALEYWDRNTSTVLYPLEPGMLKERDKIPTGTTNASQKKMKDSRPFDSKKHVVEDENSGALRDHSVGVAHIICDISSEKSPSIITQFVMSQLPSRSSVVEGYNHATSFIHCPPPYLLSVVMYPTKSILLPSPEQFTIIGSNILLEDGVVMPTSSQAPPSFTDEHTSEEPSTPTKKKGPSPTVVDKKGKGKAKGTESSTGTPDQDSNYTGSQPSWEYVKKKSLNRWIVPACGAVSLKLRFQALNMGRYDRILNMEILGTRKQYQVFCRGVCRLPDICRDPCIVYGSCKKSKCKDEFVCRVHIMDTDTFEYGPLIVANRSRSSEERPVSSTASLKILNDCNMLVDVHFMLYHPSNPDLSLELEPKRMQLKHGESKQLQITATTKTLGRLEEKVVCCIKDNPEPFIIQVACVGVQPEIEIDKRSLAFDRVMLFRKETKSFSMHSKATIPLNWRLVDTEFCGDEFTFVKKQGIIQPMGYDTLVVAFQTNAVVSVPKRPFKLEVYDTDSVLGLIQSETLFLSGESFDVIVDIGFPKDPEGTLDYGMIKVRDEAKLPCILKNKGKYEVLYSFRFLQPADREFPNVRNLFVIHPQEGKIPANEKTPVYISVSFRSKAEVVINDNPVLKCVFTDPNYKRDVIAEIPIRVSVKSLYSRFKIAPVEGIFFGPILCGSVKISHFIVENTGPFDIKFELASELLAPKWPPSPPKPAVKEAKGKQKLSPSAKGDNVVGKLILPNFAAYPAGGLILVKQKLSFTVECHMDHVGMASQVLFIDISNRNLSQYPSVQYHLKAESCSPSFNVKDMGVIFEEYPVCRNAPAVKVLLDSSDVTGAYCEQESKFTFKPIVLNTSVEAHIKIQNDGKIPCDVFATVKAPFKKPTSPRSVETFLVNPERVTVPALECTFLNIVFTPSAMEMYSAHLVVVVENIPVVLGEKTLEFDIAGEGVLPSVAVTRPLVQNLKGEPVMMFKQLCIGDTQTLPLQLQNVGVIPAKVTLDCCALDSVFALTSSQQTQALYLKEEDLEKTDYVEPGSCPMQLDSFILNPKQFANFMVIFSPLENKEYGGCIKVFVHDNPFERRLVALVGEGYITDVMLKVLPTLPDIEEEGSLEIEKIQKVPDYDIHARRLHHIDFGECHMYKAYKRLLSITNTSPSTIRFEWTAHPQLVFSPHLGHIPKNTTKDFSLSLQSEETLKLDHAALICDLWSILLIGSTPSQVDQGWDDRRKVVKWTKIPLQSSSAESVLSLVDYIEKKHLATESEPDFEIEPGSERSMELTVSATVANCNYHIEIDVMNFSDTFMYDKRIHKFYMENTGVITLDCKWQLFLLTSTGTSDLTSTPDDGTHPFPFSIKPLVCSIKPGGKQWFQVQFAPLDTGLFKGRLVARIPNLNQMVKSPEIRLQAQGLLPFCHFHLEDSDYLNSMRRAVTTPIPIGFVYDPNKTKVVEMTVVGVGIKFLRCFDILNPTKLDHEFQWVRQDRRGWTSSNQIVCQTSNGIIPSGMKAKMCFEYFGNSLGSVESFWNFVIPKAEISVPFVVVAHVVEPNVFPGNSSVVCKPLLKGQISEDIFTLVNQENVLVNFSVVPSSCFTEGRITSISIDPMSGEIRPKSKVQMKAVFHGSSVGEFIFHILIKIERRSTPLRVTIRALVSDFNVMVFLEATKVDRLELLPTICNKVDLGEVELGDQFAAKLVVLNTGTLCIEYHWTLDLSPVHIRDSNISLSPMTGYVKNGSADTCIVQVTPKRHCHLENITAKLKISQGPTYVLSLSCSTVIPGLLFDNEVVDFGWCLIKSKGVTDPYDEVVSVTNIYHKPVSVQCQYQDTSFLTVNFKPTILAPRRSKKFTISFTPHDQKVYNEIVKFVINDQTEKILQVRGEGIIIKIDLADSHQKIVKMGVLKVGQVVRKSVSVINSSKAPVPASFIMGSSKLTKEELSDCLFITYKCGKTLEPMSGQCKLQITFAPKKRYPSIQAEIMWTSETLTSPICIVQGSCKGLEVTLSDRVVMFGAVSIRTSAQRKIIMENTGDYGTSFQWDVDRFGTDFSIAPESGYITVDSQVVFTIEFRPAKISAETKAENVRCGLDQGNFLQLTVIGICTDIPPATNVLSFTSLVRQKDTVNVAITNSTNTPWTLRPIINGEHWSGPEVITVPARESAQYPITYHPLSVTPDLELHKGSIFIPIPGGGSLVYDLDGLAEPPHALATIHREIQCRTEYVELLTINNWFPNMHRFKVKIDIFKPDILDPSVTIRGMDFIDVPGKKRKDFKLHFHAYKETILAFQVIFESEQTGEYEFYELNYKTYKAGPIGTLQFSIPQRSKTGQVITLKNPLLDDVMFLGTSSIHEVTLPHVINIKPQSEAQVTVEFFPVKIGEFRGTVDAVSAELGFFQWKVEAVCTPPAPEQTTYITTYFGNPNPIQAHFPNPYQNLRLELTAKVDNNDFQVEKTLVVNSGAEEIIFDITYDPQSIGESHGVAVLNSAIIGDIVYPLVGTSLPPKPQGPFVIKTGGVLPITVRNPFNTVANFSFQVDNPQFTLNKTLETIRPRKDTKVTIAIDPLVTSTKEREPISGKMIATAQLDGQEEPSGMWLHYLKGVFV